MDTLLVYPEDYSDAQLRPCLAMFAKSKTYLTLIATAFVAFNATPSFAVEHDNWDWNSGAREEEPELSGKSVNPESKLEYEPDQTASQLSEADRPEPNQPRNSQQADRSEADRPEPNQPRNSQQADRSEADRLEPSQPRNSQQADRSEPSQPRNSQQAEEPSMSANVAKPANQSGASIKTLVAGQNWRTGGRQTAAQAAIEKNPGIEKDCDGKVLSGDDSDTNTKRAEVDAKGHPTAAGMAEIKADGKAHRQKNPNQSQYKSDKDGDVG